MGLLGLGVIAVYLLVVGAPALALGVLAVSDKRLRAGGRDAFAAAVLAVATCAAILAGLWQQEVAPALEAGRMPMFGPIFTLWGWHLAALSAVLVVGFVAGQKRPVALGLCAGAAAASWIWFVLAVGVLGGYLEGRGVRMTP